MGLLRLFCSSAHISAHQRKIPAPMMNIAYIFIGACALAFWRLAQRSIIIGDFGTMGDR